MPNHVLNRITTPTDIISTFVGEETDGGEVYKTFDFARFVPVPECVSREDVDYGLETIAKICLGVMDLRESTPRDILKVVARNNAIRHLQEGPMAKDISDDDFDKMVDMMRSYRICGSLNWHDWNRQNWGTKWNAYDVEVVSSNIVEFQTAWSAPHPVIEALAKKIDCGLLHEWADEDIGHNVGWATYDAFGKMIEKHELSKTAEGLKLAVRLHKEDESLYQWSEERKCYKYVGE